MKIRGSVVSLSFIFPHPPEDMKKKKKKLRTATAGDTRDFRSSLCKIPGSPKRYFEIPDTGTTALKKMNIKKYKKENYDISAFFWPKF